MFAFFNSMGLSSCISVHKTNKSDPNVAQYQTKSKMFTMKKSTNPVLSTIAVVMGMEAFKMVDTHVKIIHNFIKYFLCSKYPNTKIKSI